MFSLCLADEVRELQHRGEYSESRSAAQRGVGSDPLDAARLASCGMDPSVVGPCAVFLALQDASTFTGQLAARADFGTTWGPGV